MKSALVPCTALVDPLSLVLSLLSGADDRVWQHLAELE
jgi:hypothetical protein